mgnify:CR=1 FL=1
MTKREMTSLLIKLMGIYALVQSNRRFRLLIFAF